MTSILPREPEVPIWTAAFVQQCERTVFARTRPEPSDLLFVFGSPEGDWLRVARLYQRGYAPWVLVTGGGDRHADGCAEAERIVRELEGAGVPLSAMLVEAQAMNTLENVCFAIELLRRRGLAPRSILFFAHAHHAGRAWRTLARWLPGVRLSCATHDAIYDGVPVRHSDWAGHETSRRRVYGEYMRIQRYAAQGDCLLEVPSRLPRSA